MVSTKRDTPSKDINLLTIRTKMVKLKNFTMKNTIPEITTTSMENLAVSVKTLVLPSKEAMTTENLMLFKIRSKVISTLTILLTIAMLARENMDKRNFWEMAKHMVLIMELINILFLDIKKPTKFLNTIHIMFLSILLINQKIIK